MMRGRLPTAFLLASVVLSDAGPLHVLRTTPASPADPFDVVTVTFDRPVAGGLDQTVDPTAIFDIAPAVAGTVEWRDPVTLRFSPSAPLTPGATYVVTIRSSFAAMDGSRLDEPFHYTFTVSPPKVLEGSPAGVRAVPRYLGTEPVFSVLLSAEPDVDELARNASIRLGCGGGTVALRPAGTPPRRIGPDDPGSFRWAGVRGWPAPDSAHDLRRVVDLVPAEPLAPACSDTLLLPTLSTGSTTSLRWPFRTRGPLRVAVVTCSLRWCPTGPIGVSFTTPVRGADVMRHVHVGPNVHFTLGDTSRASAGWSLLATLTPHHTYTVRVDSTLEDVFGQRLATPVVRAVTTTGYAPAVSYEYGSLLVERDGLGTLAVQHVNADTLVLSALPVPDSLEPAFLGQRWGWGAPWGEARSMVREDTFVVGGAPDERTISGIRPDRSKRPGESGATLWAVRVSSPQLDSLTQRNQPIALVQVTDLAITARVGVDEAVVWVTGVHDGTARPGAAVALHDYKGRVLATGRTDDRGLTTLRHFRTYDDPCRGWQCNSFEGYVSASLGDDRALVPISAYDPDLSPWHFNVSAAWGASRAPVAAAVFTERGIYRPGEPVYAKAILRRGTLGALTVPRGDSIRWLFHDRARGLLRDTVTALSPFGTAEQRLPLAQGLPLGTYQVEVQARVRGEWQSVASDGYRVAEYRPPEFLVDVVGASGPKLAGDSADFHVSAHYLFGAPMGHAPVTWSVRSQAVSPWELDIPGTDGYAVGVAWSWWDEGNPAGPRVLESGVDSLDATGAWDVRKALPGTSDGRPTRVTFVATVTDANRQIASSSASVLVHPAAFYIGARPRGSSYFWKAGEPVSIDVITVEPGGTRTSGVPVTGTVVRREWHSTRLLRDGNVRETGSWVADTVASCTLRTAADPVACDFTPEEGGSYTVSFTAKDDAGRDVRTTLQRWASGKGWMPWNDASKFKMDVVPDRSRYTVGDTATVFFASPITDADAWITVERERVLEQRRLHITSGATTLKFPITEAYAPNVFVSIVVVRGRSAPPGPLDDPGRPTLRVGYTQLRVTPEVKRLSVDITPARPEYRPGDSATFALTVKDRSGAGRRAEVTLWAVDEGVLALTGYRTPDPIDLLYPARGLGMRLASNLVAVAPQVPEGQKGSRSPGGGGGADATGILRSRFQSTAFFLGSVVTDAAGRARVTAPLPDNVTTFRVMAVAVTEGDRYGSGSSKLLVTLPLLARPALPRFVREGDRFRAGVVVNSRMGGTPTVDVRARTSGIRLEGDSRKSQKLREGRGADVRFDFEAEAGDSAHFRFDATSGSYSDAVAVAVPIRPSSYPLSSTVSGVVHDTATVEIELQDNVDPTRSRIEIHVGSSVLTAIEAARARMRLYPYDCTEQVSSAALPLVALLDAQALYPDERIAPADARAQVERAVRVLSARQRPDGGIGFWSYDDWTSPWLTSYAGRVLLEARAAGIAVQDTVLAGIAGYLSRALHERGAILAHSAVGDFWLGGAGAQLAERTAAVDFLSRAGRPDVAMENTLVSQASRLRWEDRLLLGEVLARRHQLGVAKLLILGAAGQVKVEGRKAVLPDSAGLRFYFASRGRAAARLLDALLSVDPQSPLLDPLVETLLDQGRVDAARPWNTQDYGSMVLALVHYERARRAAPPTTVRVSAGGRTLLVADGEIHAPRDTVLSLQGFVQPGDDGRPPRAELSLQADGGSPAYYSITVRETPRGVQLTPVERGIQVDRWYENATTGKPIVSAAEGDLVRVRLRLRVPAVRTFVVLDDPLPAGLEPVDLSLRTLSAFGATVPAPAELEQRTGWYYGSWDSGVWSAFDHKELRDDRVVYSATVLWPGTYTATYLARATAAGTFLYPPAHAEEMYNPGVNGRTGGGTFTVRTPGR